MCGYRFKKGQSYLVDARGSEALLHAGACGITSSTREAQDAIRLLRTLKEHNDGAVIFGTVKQYIGKPNFVALNNRPISGAIVTLDSEGKSRNASVDKTGWYQFTGLPSGNYKVTATLPTELSGANQHTIEVLANGCSQIDFRASVKK
jgi:hypothetical protein